MENVAKIAGCRLAFDNFASTSLPLCVGKNWKKYSDLIMTLLSTEQKIIVNMTGCQGEGSFGIESIKESIRNLSFLDTKGQKLYFD